MRPTLTESEWLQWRDLVAEIAEHNGDAPNASGIGRRLGLSYHAVLKRLAGLEGMQLTRVLPVQGSRRTHVLLRDCHLLLALGGTPQAIMRTCLTECIVKGIAASLRGPISCWESGVKRIDLVTPTERERIGFVFTGKVNPRNRELAPLRLGVEKGVIDRGFLVHQGLVGFVAARVVIGLPVGEFLGHLDRWLACGSFREAHGLLRERLEAGLAPRDARAYPPASCAFAVSTMAAMFSAGVSAGAAPAGARM
jgi:hypothetical protein